MYEGTRTSKKGNELTGLYVEGTKHGYKDAPDEPYSRFFTDFYDMLLISKFKTFNAGDKVNIVNEQQGGYWRIVDVKLLGENRPVDVPQPPYDEPF